MNNTDIMEWLKERTPREQWILFGFGFIIIFAIWNLIVERPVIFKINEYNKSIINLKSEQIQLNDQLQLFDSFLKSPSYTEFAKEHKVLLDKVKGYNQWLAKVQTYFVQFKDLSRIARDIYNLNKNINITNYSMAQSVLLDQKNISSKLLINRDLYKYTIKITLRGNYFDTLDFFKKLELLDWHLYLEEFNYKVDKYPFAETTAQFYVLSYERD